ncbi:hypothetical protein EDB86DRAFT_2803462, partial [Lactarius hatsudake]
KQEKLLTNEHSTLRRHAAAVHPRRYRKWCDSNRFDSMLPEDSKKRKRVEKDRQSLVIDHFGPEDPTTKPIPFSEKALRTAALEWMIATDQPIQVFKHPTFTKMLDIASRANRSIQLPSPKQSRAQVIKMFKQQLCSLRDRLNVTFFFFFFFLFFSFLFAFKFTDILSCSLVGPHCDWRSQPDM